MKPSKIRVGLLFIITIPQQIYTNWSVIKSILLPAGLGHPPPTLLRLLGLDQVCELPSISSTSSLVVSFPMFLFFKIYNLFTLLFHNGSLHIYSKIFK